MTDPIEALLTQWAHRARRARRASAARETGAVTRTNMAQVALPPTRPVEVPRPTAGPNAPHGVMPFVRPTASAVGDLEAAAGMS